MLESKSSVGNTSAHATEKYCAHVVMQRYWWPGFEMQLLRELQRQQNNAQFCDTLLQTEGISVPAHSCVLAALSPYLSEKLSASPPPPSGQKRQLQLQTVKAQTLLKLVGLLYSGELEVKGSLEQNDVLSAARQFGIADLVERQKDLGTNEGEKQRKSSASCIERNESRKIQDTQVQAEMAGTRATDCAAEKRSCVSTNTQTVKVGEKTVGSLSLTHSGQTKTPVQEPASSSAQRLYSYITLQPQNTTLHKHIYTTCVPPVPNVPRWAPSDGDSTLDRSSDSLTKPTSTSALSSDVMSFPISLNEDSNSPTPQEDSSYQQSSEFGDRVGMSSGEEKTNPKTADRRENTERASTASRDEILGEEKENPTEKKLAHANAGMRNMAKMKQMQKMMESTQISIKVKLRRRTKGEVWEVVSIQDADETLSVLTSLKQVDKNYDMDHTNGEVSSDQPGPINKPDTQILLPATTSSPEPPPHPNTTSELLCSDCFTPNESDELESVPLPQPPGPVEESDEQIEKLWEDIMMGLNILPDLDKDCKKSHRLQPSHDRALVSATENDRAQSQMHTAVTAAGGVFHQEFGTQIGHSTPHTAPYQPSCSSLSSVQSDAVIIMKQRDGPSQQELSQSKSQNGPHTEEPTTRSVVPTAFSFSGKKLHYPADQEPSSQNNQSALEFLPLTNGSLHPFSLPCMDDLQLPRCLSPLEPFASAAKHEPVLNNSTNHGNKIQPQPCLHGRPWLTVNPGSLQFPFSAITHRENKSVSLPQGTNHSSWSGTISAEVKPDIETTLMKESSKQSDTIVDAAAPKRRKRKRTSHLQDAAGCLLCKNVNVSDGTKSQISMSVCSVSLSSNNVLAKERDMSASSSDMPYKLLGKPDEPSTVTESQREKTTLDVSNDQTRIRTRGFLKKTQETPCNTCIEHSLVVKPPACRAKTVKEQEVPTQKRKRGRPRKTKLEEAPPAISEKKSHGVEGEQEADNSLPKEVKRCNKRRRNRSEVEVIPIKRTDRAEADDSTDVIPAEIKAETPKQPKTVILERFEKLIKRQHSKTRKSKESQDKETNEPERDVESKETAHGSRCEDLIQETEMDIDVTQPQDKDGTEESPHVIFSVTVDKNHNQIFSNSTAEYSESQQDDTNSSTSEEFGVFGDGCHPVLAAEREQTLQSPDEAQQSCDARVSDTTQQTAVNDEGLCHSNSHTPPQEDKVPLDNLNPQTPERTGPPLPDTGAAIKSSGCNQQDDDDDDEEVDVDILLYSPDKESQPGECENGLDDMDINLEEEEDEEDVNEIDVTGDEAE